MEQHEITQAGPLLDAQGNLREAGYAKKLLPQYDRNRIKGHVMRIKEWDYYLVMNGQFALALTIADNSYMGLDSISHAPAAHGGHGNALHYSGGRQRFRRKGLLPTVPSGGGTAATLRPHGAF